MRVNFESNVDDAVNLNLRLMARSKVLRGADWRSYLPVAVIYGLAVSGLSYIMLRGHEEQVVVSIVGGIVAGLVLLVLGPRLIRRKLRRYYLEQIGTDDDYQVEFELLPEGLSVKRLGCRFIFDWDTVEELCDAPEFLDIRMRHGGLASVKKSAFESEQQFQRFKEEINRHLHESAK